MITQFFKADINSIDVFKECGEIIISGGLVAFPTETVYGLGANALDKNSVEKIYKAKGRPSDNPLIVHISDISDLEKVACEINEKGLKLAKKFWPGPITLIFKKNTNIPYEVTSDMDTIAVRLPENEIARNIIKFSSVPIAAPSANVSGRPSPTMAHHVKYDLDGKIDAIVDGGHCEYGIESTIVDVSVEPPVLLRPGSITVEMIEEIIGPIEIDLNVIAEEMISITSTPRAPGMKYKHYSPEASITIVEGNTNVIVNYINNYNNLDVSNKIGVLTVDENIKFYDADKFFVVSLGSKNDLKEIASNLFTSFRIFDENNIKIVFAESFENKGVALAIMNRLKKAAGFNTIKL